MSDLAVVNRYEHVLTESRAGFYAENLLLYSKQAQEEGTLPLPVGKNNKFPPVALGVNPLPALR